jgi:hypothetical protein
LAEKINKEDKSFEAFAVNKFARGFNVTSRTEAGARKMGQEQKWARSLYASAKVTRATYPVEVHGVDVKDTGLKEGGMRDSWLKQLTKENTDIVGGFQIDRLVWKNKRAPVVKGTTTLVIYPTEWEASNSMMTNGVIMNERIMTCTMHFSTGRPEHCFKYLSWEGKHRAHSCNKTV